MKHLNKKINYYYIVLNDGINLATPDRGRAVARISELLDMMEHISRCKNWKISIAYE